MHRRLRSTVPALAVIVGLSLPAWAGAQRAERGFADAVLGRWDLTVEGPNGRYPSWMEIRLRTEWQLAASFVGRFGSVRHAAEATFADGRLGVRIPVQYERNPTDLVFDGRLDGGRLSGYTTGEDGTPRRWTAVRAPSLARDAEPRWGRRVALFNGSDLAGWRERHDGRPGCWSVEAGLLAATPPCVDLISEAEFGDFLLHAEFRYPEGSNSGLYLRGRYEIQIQDDAGRAPDPLRIGGVYGFITPVTDAARPAGDWQSIEATLIGRRVTVLLNGVEIIRDAEIPGITGGALDSDEGEPGPLMLQGDHGPIEFRTLTVTPAR